MTMGNEKESGDASGGGVVSFEGDDRGGEMRATYYECA